MAKRISPEAAMLVVGPLLVVGGVLFALLGSIAVGFTLTALPLSNDLRGALAVVSGVLLAIITLALVFLILWWLSRESRRRTADD